DLLEARRVAADRAGRDRDLEGEALVVEATAQRVDGVRDHRREVDRPPLDLELAGADAGDIEEVVDEARELRDLPLQDHEVALRIIALLDEVAGERDRA